MGICLLFFVFFVFLVSLLLVSGISIIFRVHHSFLRRVWSRVVFGLHMLSLDNQSRRQGRSELECRSGWDGIVSDRLRSATRAGELA
jgi:hypothetical protein